MLKNIFLSEKKLLNAILRASKNTILCFSANKQIMRMRGHRCSKTSFSVRKVAKCNFKSKLKHMKNVFLMKEHFLHAEDRFS